jgi:hypothetical protein
MSIAEQLDPYVKEQLQKIRIGQNIPIYGLGSYTFRTDAGQLVDKQMEYTEHPNDMPSIVFYSGKHRSTTEGAELGMEIHQQEISIEGFIACDKAGSEGDDLKADITAAIKSDPWFGSRIDQLLNYETDVAIQVGDAVFSVVKVSFTASYSALYGSE